ncbi:ATP-binding cassette domain-containing protein [Shinella sp. DD12]|uniref:ATP-binding cassette domain-containing protein n=1 Tax=Shinella sp. DD12 TaxID=1410620 RepID=UPI0034D19841
MNDLPCYERRRIVSLHERSRTQFCATALGLLAQAGAPHGAARRRPNAEAWGAGGLVGAFGSGKTTLLRSLLAIEEPDCGHISVCGCHAT